MANYRTAAHEAIAKAFNGAFYGYIPDPDHKRRQKDSTLRFGGNPTVPNQASLARFRCPLFDQGPVGSCFPAGTPIRMADGAERPIEEIGIGNEVITHNGKCRRVTKCFRQTYDGPIYTLSVKGYGYGLRMTSEHPICVVRNGSARSKWEYTPGGIDWVAAKDLRPTDVILMPAQTDIEEPRNPESLRVARTLEVPTQTHNSRTRTLCSPASSGIPADIVVDTRFARLVGLFLAEGSYRKSDGSPVGIQFTFARHEKEYQAFVVEAAREIFGVEPKLLEFEGRPSVSDVRIDNATVAHLFLALCGEYALHKRVSRVFFSAPRPIRLALLRGWLEGDGDHEIVRVGKKSAQLHGATSSETMHRDMFRLAMSCGLKPGAQVRVQQEHQNAQPRTLSFYSTDIFEIFPEARAEVEAAGLNTEGGWKKYWKHELGFACRVKSIEIEQPEEPIEVFNLEVEGDHTYIAENIAVHNCTGHGTAQAIYTSAKASGSPLPYIPSPKSIYSLARILERSDSSQKLTDSGAAPSDLLTVLRQFGIEPFVGPTPDGRYSDVTPENVADEPSLLDLEVAGLKLLTGEYRVDEKAPNLAIQIQASIASNATAGIGIFVDIGFMNWSGIAGPINNIDLTDPNGGGHWLSLDYYYTHPTFGLVFGGPNSWGDNWPSHPMPYNGSPFWQPGCYEITASCLAKAMSDCLLFPVAALP